MRAHLRCSNHRVRCPQPNPPPRSAWPPERRARALQRSTHTTNHAVTTRARRTASTGTRRRQRFKKWTQFKESVFIRTRGLHACTCTCTCTCTCSSTGGRRAGPGPSTTLHTNTTSHHGATPIGCPKQERRRRPTQQKGVDKKKCCARQGAEQASTWHYTARASAHTTNTYRAACPSSSASTSSRTRTGARGLPRAHTGALNARQGEVDHGHGVEEEGTVGAAVLHLLQNGGLHGGLQVTGEGVGIGHGPLQTRQKKTDTRKRR